MPNLTLAGIPGFADVPNSVLEAEQDALGIHLNRISQNAHFGMVRCEIFTGIYYNEDVVELPTSRYDGYQFQRDELMYIWTPQNTANKDTNWATYREPWTMWYLAADVNQETGEVLSAIGYRGNNDHKDRQAETNDGALQVFTIAQRNLTGLVMAEEPLYDDILAAEFYQDRPYNESLIQQMNDNAKHSVVNCEVIYMGEFTHGQTVPQPQSPIDEKTYAYSDVRFMSCIRYTMDTSGGVPVVPAISKGQLQDWSHSVNPSTGAVTITIKYELSGPHSYNTGKVAVFAFCIRDTGTGLPVADDFAEIPTPTFMFGATLPDVNLSQVNDNTREACFTPEIFDDTYEHGDVIPLPTSPIDGYTYTREELMYIWSWADTGPSGETTDRMSLIRGHISDLGAVSIDSYRFSSGDEEVDLEHTGTMLVFVFAKRLAAHTFVDNTPVEQPTDPIADDDPIDFTVNGV